ncbi:branched-chain amino acid ABC transporter permease [Plantactinospora sp. WMMB334]|uniref:branched-chain amino acid ABC transporter permease n=1 Tax=Plantactinospora sp. WMMB334 TaxID=3404119 RepID=UPI003B939BF2
MAIQLLNALAYGSLLLILALGLAMIFGLGGVFNFGHGALYMFSAYTAYSLSSAVSFWLALVTVPAVLALVGYLVDKGAFRFLRSRDPIELAIITYGGALVIENVVVILWGTQPKALDPPAPFDSSVSVLGDAYPSYRLFIIVFSLAVAIGIASWLRYSRMGLHVRAASRDLEMTGVAGVNTDRLNAVVAAVSFGLAGVAGVLVAPYATVSIDMGARILVIALIVTTVGGLGSIGGAAIAAIALGLIQVIGDVNLPGWSALTPYVVMIIVLIVHPRGIAGRIET